MNNNDFSPDDYRSLLLLDEISKNDELTQRDLSKNLGIALGLINSYLKNLISKGYITVSAIPKKRYKYYLTPGGFAEKTRLTYHHLQNFTNLYRVARKDFRSLFHYMERSEVKRVAFCGVDEVAEIAYLSLKETELALAGIIDDTHAGKEFFGLEVLPLEKAGALDCDLIVVTTFRKGDEMKRGLVEAGISEEKTCDISGGGWIEKLDNAEAGSANE